MNSDGAGRGQALDDMIESSADAVRRGEGDGEIEERHA